MALETNTIDSIKRFAICKLKSKVFCFLPVVCLRDVDRKRAENTKSKAMVTFRNMGTKTMIRYVVFLLLSEL